MAHCSINWAPPKGGGMSRLDSMRSLVLCVAVAGLVSRPHPARAAEAPATAPPAAAAPPATPMRLTAMAVNLSGVGRATPQRLDLVVERWSTDAERNALLETLKKGGSDALLDALQDVKPRAGYIRTPTSLGWNVQFARVYP